MYWYCYYYSVMYVTVMSVIAYVALAFVFFMQNKLMKCVLHKDSELTAYLADCKNYNHAEALD